MSKTLHGSRRARGTTTKDFGALISDAYQQAKGRYSGAFTADHVRQLFALSRRSSPPADLPAYDARFCEEHLSLAIQLANQVVQERQLVFLAGEKFAGALLEIFANSELKKIAVEESKSADSRNKAAESAVKTHTKVAPKVTAQVAAVKALQSTVNPASTQALSDAQRVRDRSYLSRGITSGGGHLNFTTGARTDEPPYDGAAPYEIRPNGPVVDMESELERRIFLAGRRDLSAELQRQVLAAEADSYEFEGRKAFLDNIVLSEAANVSGVKIREELLDQIASLRKAYAEDINLLGFEKQMLIHKKRAEGVCDEAAARLLSARDGLTSIYGLQVTKRLPTFTPENVESLLELARQHARDLTSFEKFVCQQQIVISLRGFSGPSWKDQLKKGLPLDLSPMLNSAKCARMRDLRCEAEGKSPWVFLNISAPVKFSDRNLQGKERSLAQAASTVVLSTNRMGATEAGETSVSRIVHNLGFRGVWTLTSPGSLDGVDDLQIAFRVSYFV
jgi:hypothetical protein